VFLLTQNSTGQLKKEGDARPQNFKQTDAWANVVLRSGKKYEGWPEFFEGSSQSSELYLSPACQLIKKRCNTIAKPIQGPGIIIFEREIESITFVDRDKSQCANFWLPLYK
jgi:hypothetical protein